MSLTMAGIVPREAVAILVRALWPVLLTTNAILLLFYVGAGFGLGWLAARFWDEAVRVTGRALSRLVQFLLVTVSLLAVAALAFATVAVRYPFQYDHLLNAQGGWLRRVQEVLTSRANPDVLEAAMWALIGLLALPTIVRAALRRPLPAAALLIPALAVAGSHSSPSTAGVNAGPNVVLILLESARSDMLSVNGFPEPTTPHLERLMAENGVTFTNAWGHINGTVAEVVTLMTSAYSHRHGIRSMFHGEEFTRPGLPRLPALLRAHGFATRVVADWDGDTTYFNDRCPYPYYARFPDPAYEGPRKSQAMSNPKEDQTAGREREARQIRGLSAGCVSALDDNIGFVADALRRFGLDRHTTLIIT